jgi:hypothetical protein
MMGCATPDEAVHDRGLSWLAEGIPGDTSHKDQGRKGAPQCLLFLALSRFELR